MFVSRLRPALPDHELFNLAHRGYGTDQALLTFLAWEAPGELAAVVLVFSENDPHENRSDFAYGKFKPRFELAAGAGGLRLTGVPVPRAAAWDREEPAAPPARRGLLELAFRSHLLADVLVRLTRPPEIAAEPALAEAELAVTERLLVALDDAAEARGARLLVAFVPSKREIEGLRGYVPYQAELGRRCQARGLACVDLAPDLAASWRRTYFRLDMHWNREGHRVAARALEREIARLLAAPG